MKKKTIAVSLVTILSACMLAPCANAFLHGDVDADDKLTSADARIALRASVGGLNNSTAI